MPKGIRTVQQWEVGFIITFFVTIGKNIISLINSVQSIKKANFLLKFYWFMTMITVIIKSFFFHYK